MSSNLESFCPKLRAGRVIPQGSRIIFETENPYNQIVLPVALADFILLCSGQFSVREIVEKMYKRQGVVPFKAMLTALHLLHRGGFFENGNELVLSSHLQSWMRPTSKGWGLSWRFGQRIASASRSPIGYYVLTLLALLAAIFGLQYFPLKPFATIHEWTVSRDTWSCFLDLFICSSCLLSLRYAMCGVQLLLLTSKAYNVSIRLSPLGAYLHVGDEANDLFENRLYTSMFHVSQILAPWAAILVGHYVVDSQWHIPMIAVASLMIVWEINPFVNSEGRKLIHALLMENDRDVVSWHFEVNSLLNSINPEARRRDQDFVRLCEIWGVIYLLMTFTVLHRVAVTFGPELLSNLPQTYESPAPWIGLLAWLTGLYYVARSMVGVIGAAIVRPYWNAARARLKSLSKPPKKPWPVNSIVRQIEGLPLFSHFHEQYLERIAAQAEILEFSEDATIIKQGEESQSLYVLLEGEVSVLREHDPHNEHWSFRMGAVSVFGESSLVDDTPRGASVFARATSVVLKVPVHLLKEVALEAQSVRHLEVFRNAILVNQFFTSSPVFRSLSAPSIDYLCSRGTLEYFDQDVNIFRQGEAGDSLYLILRGVVEVEIHNTPIKRLYQGSFFGEIALIANIPRTATIRTITPSVFFKISADAFWEVLVQHMDLGVFIESVSETRLKEDLALAPRLGNAS